MRRLLAIGELILAGFAEAAEHDRRPLEEIVVTAQRKEERLSEVPISLSAFSGEFLAAADVDGLHELAEFAPNLFVPSNPCCMTVAIRGHGTPFAVSSFDPTVAVVVDELLLPRDVYVTEPLYDLERFEILRGPQGTLFGKNSPAGLFNVVTAKPTEELAGFVSGRVGTLGTHRLEAAIGGPLAPFGDRVQVRVAALDARLPGDVENTKLGDDDPNAEQRAGRFTLALQPADGLEALVSGSLAHSESRFHGQQHDLSEASDEFLRQFDPRFEDDGTNHRNSINGRDPLRRDTYVLQTNVRYALDRWLPLRDAALVGIFGVSGFDFDRALDVDASPADILNLVSPVDFIHDQRSAELRFSASPRAPFGWGELELLAGYLFFDADLVSRIPFLAGEDFDEYLLSAPAAELVTGIPPPGGVGFEDLNAVAAALGLSPLADVRLLQDDGARFLLEQATRSHSPFGNLVWRPNEQWALGLGGRVTIEEKGARVMTQCLQPGVVCPLLGVEEYALALRRSETDFSPRITLQYFPFEGFALFATHAQGFKSGGFNNLSFTSNDAEVEPEKSVSWEAGARGTLFDERLGYGATLFQTTVDDFQLQSIVGTQVQVRNAASTRSRGLELDFQWQTPWSPLALRGAGAFTDARFLDFPNATAPAHSSSATQDLSGRRMPFVPKVQFSATPELRLPLRPPIPRILERIVPPMLMLRAALDVLYRSSQFLDYDLDRRTLQAGYVLLDARLSLAAEEAWSIGVAVENLTDADASEAMVDSPAFPGGLLALQEFRRRFTAEVRYAF